MSEGNRVSEMVSVFKWPSSVSIGRLWTPMAHHSQDHLRRFAYTQPGFSVWCPLNFQASMSIQSHSFMGRLASASGQTETILGKISEFVLPHIFTRGWRSDLLWNALILSSASLPSLCGCIERYIFDCLTYMWSLTWTLRSSSSYLLG